MEMSERIGTMTLEELCEISYDPKNCCHISYNPENCCDILYDPEYCWTFIMKNNLNFFLFLKKKKKRNKNHKNKVIQFKQTHLSFGYCHKNETFNICRDRNSCCASYKLYWNSCNTNKQHKNQNYLKVRNKQLTWQWQVYVAQDRYW